MNAEGIILIDLTGIKKEVVNYYQGFLQQHATDFELVTVQYLSKLIDYQCPQEVANGLVKPIGAEEIEEYYSQCQRIKRQGLMDIHWSSTKPLGQ